MSDVFPTLSSLRGLRTAPSLSLVERSMLRQELQLAMGRCAWFTLGVMAPSAEAAGAALRQCEAACGWSALELQNPESLEEQPAGGVFLKANQSNGRYLIRAEEGLGEGLLITGHQPADTAQEDTWGPLPLDLFAAP